MCRDLEIIARSRVYFLINRESYNERYLMMSISIAEGIASRNIFKRVTPISGALSHSCKPYSHVNDLACEFSARPTHHRLPRNLIEHRDRGIHSPFRT